MRKLILALPMLLISCQPAFGLDTSASGTTAKIDVDRLAEAIYKAEGGARAKKPYGILSVPCEGKEHCGRICRNTIRNNLKRWAKSGSKMPYIEFLGARYAPIGADNDNGSNRHWVRNVSKFYGSM